MATTRHRHAPLPEYWVVEIYEDASGIQPFEVFFDKLDQQVADRLTGYIDDIAREPVRYPPGPAWQAMHGDAVGVHEVRVRVRNTLYRVYVRLDAGPFAGFPEMGRFVLLDGERKAVATALAEAVYTQIGAISRDYAATRRVSPATAE